MTENSYYGLHSLVPADRAKRKPKRVGRGESSGMGKTSGRGHKGQKARKSGNVRPGFEGGQNPLIQTHPKRGFKRKHLRLPTIGVVNLKRVSEVFTANAEVTAATLIAAGAVPKDSKKIKILGLGELAEKMTFRIHSASGSAIKKIEAMGCEIEWLNK